MGLRRYISYIWIEINVRVASVLVCLKTIDWRKNEAIKMAQNKKQIRAVSIHSNLQLVKWWTPIEICLFYKWFDYYQFFFYRIPIYFIVRFVFFNCPKLFSNRTSWQSSIQHNVAYLQKSLENNYTSLLCFHNCSMFSIENSKILYNCKNPSRKSKQSPNSGTDTHHWFRHFIRRVLHILPNIFDLNEFPSGN